MSERLVIRGGTVVDGTGGPGRAGRADVLVDCDRIVAVGAVPEEAAARVMDARGLVVAPGFVDVHTHADLPLLRTSSSSTLARNPLFGR